MKKIFRIYFTLSLIGFFILIFSKREKFFQSDEDFFKSLINNYSSMVFNGKVTSKFFDEKDHDRMKIILNDNTILFADYENPEFYHFIEIGDSLIKRRNSLHFELKRKYLDTILFFKFENVKGFMNSEVYDSIKTNYPINRRNLIK